jgi:hypothetical protein
MYFTNSVQEKFISVAINEMGEAAGKVSKIATDSNGEAYDDIGVNSQGNTYFKRACCGWKVDHYCKLAEPVQLTSAIWKMKGDFIAVNCGDRTSIHGGQAFEINIYKH